MSFSRGLTAYIGPNRSEPPLHLFLSEHRKHFLLEVDRSISSTLSQGQNVLNVVLDDRSGLVRFSIEPRTVSFSFRSSICNLVPENGCEAVKAKRSGPDLNICVQRHNVMLSATFSWHAYVADNAAYSTP